MREDAAETFEDEEEGPCDLIESDDKDCGHDLMARKAARKSLDFDEMRPPRGTKQQFAPRAIKNPALLPDSDEESSLPSGSSQTSRTRLQETFRVIGCKTDCDMARPQIFEWIEEVVNADMLRAGNFEDLKKKPNSIGGFRQAHVSQLQFSCVT